MNKLLVQLASCLALAAGLVACQPKNPSSPTDRPTADGSNVAEDGTGRLTISRPEDGALLRMRGVLLEGTVTVPGLTEVRVAGQAVPVEDGAFRHQMTLDEGNQAIVVTAGDLMARTDVFVDSLAPEIIVESPTPASFVDSSTLRISGRVDDLTLETLTLDGEPVSVDGSGRFSAELAVTPGGHRYRLHATDETGHETYVHTSAVVGPFAPGGSPLPSGMALHLGQEAIDEIARGARHMLEQQDVQAVIMQQNPIMDAWWGDLHVLGERHGAISTALTTMEGRIIATVEVRSVHTDFQLQSSIANADGVADAESAILVAPLRVDVVDGRIQASLDEVTAELMGFTFEMDYLPTFVSDWDFVRESVRTNVEQGLIEAVQSTLPQWIEWTLSSLPLEGPIPIGDLSVDVNAVVAGIDVDASGLGAVLDVGLHASVPSLSRTTQAPGSVRVGHGEVPISATGGLELAVALDVLNAAVYSAWASGAFDTRTGEVPYQDSILTVETLAIVVPAMADLAPVESPVIFDVRTLLPPVIAFAADGTLELQAVDVSAELLAVTAGGDVHLGTISVAGFAPIDASFVDGILLPRFGDYRVVADLVDGPPGTPEGPSLEILLESPMADLVPWLLDIGGVPVPAFYGFEADSPSAGVVDGYLHLGAALAYTPAP